MPFFAEETIQAVRSIPLYDIVRPVVELKRVGQNWRGLSPFSQEKTPSFYVLTERNFYKCHSTGQAGDGIRFLQETEKLTFPEAVETLAERFSIQVKYVDGKAPDPEERGLKQSLLDTYAYAAEVFHKAFMADGEDAAEVRRYWEEERGFSLDLAREFQIGFAPLQPGALLAALQQKGLKTRVLAESGLFHLGREAERPESWYPFFRGRLMIPIRDIQGQVIAFTARQLTLTPKDHGSWKAKYINSPETLLFKKNQTLFNLERARKVVREAGRMLLVEGQLDALRSWASGLQETVAPQGTSVTDGQLDIIKRYTDRLDVLLDADEAGQRAVLRLIPMAFQQRLEVTVITLPEGKDPDDLLRETGADGVQALPVRSAIAFACQALLGEPSEVTPERRARVVENILQMIHQCPSDIVCEGYLEEAGQHLGVSLQILRREFNKLATQARPLPAPETAKEPPKRNTSEPLTKLEADLLWAVLQNVAWIELLAQVIDHQWINPQFPEGKILSLLLAHATVDHIEGTDAIYMLLESDDERACFHRILSEDRPHLEMESFVNQTLESLARRYCRNRITDLNQQINAASGEHFDAGQLRALTQEKRDLQRHLNGELLPRLSLPALEA